MNTKHPVHIMMFRLVIIDGDVMLLFIFPYDLSLNSEAYIKCLDREGTIYQPLRSGRIWHKVNF